MKEQPPGFEQGLPLTEVLKILNKLTISNDVDHIGINFLFNPRVGANAAGEQVDPSTITIRITPPLKNVTLLQLLDTIWQMAEPPLDTRCQITPSGSSSRRRMRPTIGPLPMPCPRCKLPPTGRPIRKNTQLVTEEIVPVHGLDPSQVVKALSTLVPQGARMAIGGSNAVVMTARRSDVRRIAQIISALDSAGDGDLRVFLLQFADSKTVASELKGIFSTQDGGLRINAVSDDSNNAVVVRAPEDLMPGISNTISKLDIPREDTVQLTVFNLRNADCTAVAKKLSALFSDTSLQAGQNQNGAQGAALKKQVPFNVVPDPRTQSVLVTAPKDTMAQIEKIIDQMDKDPAKSANSSPPVPNTIAKTNGIYVSPGRQVIMRKLRDIKLAELPASFEQGLPLTEVMHTLKEISISNDVENVGVNFMFNPRGSPGGSAPDATTAAPPAVDAGTITVKITPPLHNVTLLEALDAICQTADQPLSYAVEDYAVWFFVKPPALAGMETRRFHVDPNTFIKGLQAVTSRLDVDQANTTGGGIQAAVTPPTTDGQSPYYHYVTNLTADAQALHYITTNSVFTNNMMVTRYFRSLGINLTNNGAFALFNPQTGDVMVRNTAENLDKVERAIAQLNKAALLADVKRSLEQLDKAPPLVQIRRQVRQPDILKCGGRRLGLHDYQRPNENAGH